MRQILILSPNFPPNDAVDMHRIRMTVGHFVQNGWNPVILRVAPRDTGRRIDEDLLATLPPGLEVFEVAAPRRWLAAIAGLNATGLRAWRALDRMGRLLLAGRQFDLVFISTTEFPVMALGRAWKQRFGVPFLLDFQDPWGTYPASAVPFLPMALKHRVMRFIHRRLEAWTLPVADGLIAVSQSYVDLLRDAYPILSDRPAMASPFPYAASDFAIAAAGGQAVDGLKRPGTDLFCLYAGRIAPAMEASLTACLALVAAGRKCRPEVFDRLHFVIVGTGYALSGNPSVAMRLAAATGMADRVIEYPDRVGFLDAQKSMLDADILLVLGSDDEGYMPSKLNQSLSLAKPVICAAPVKSRASAAVDGLETVLNIVTGQPPTEAIIDALANKLYALLMSEAPDAYAERAIRTEPFEAAQSAKRDCAFFDQVVDAAGSSKRRTCPHGR